jgi:superoxide dismutase, Fe-Mn family
LLDFLQNYLSESPIIRIMKFTLSELDYSYDALEPYIDRETMKIHHQKHHLGYVDKLNNLIEEDATLGRLSLEELLDNPKTANPAGGHINHSFFWEIMSPRKTEPGELTEKMIKNNWGSTSSFFEAFFKKALGVFGSGWAWLVILNNQFEITTTPNQNSPISLGQTPILGVDVWEHAYYLKYKNKRDEYLKAWRNVVNWKQVEENLKKSFERGPP